MTILGATPHELLRLTSFGTSRAISEVRVPRSTGFERWSSLSCEQYITESYRCHQHGMVSNR